MASLAKTLRLTSLLIAGLTALCMAQIQTETCILSTPAAPPPIERGGMYMTPTGNVRVLLVFVQFLDDNADLYNAYWRPDQPPTYMNTFIDATPTQHSTSGNLTHFYREMSFDRLILYGDPYYVKLHHNEDYYRNTLNKGNRAFLYSNRDALIQLDTEQGVNFALYDNWTFTKTGYHHAQGADGAVDMIIMYYRNMTWPPSTTGDAELITDSDLYLDGKAIRADFPGSGLTNNGGTLGTSLYSVRHEVAHYLLGFDSWWQTHPVCSNTDQNEAMWGLLMRWATFANSNDRYMLGWQDYNEVASNTTATLGDYVTGGVACRIMIPGTNEAFIVENHQQLSQFDIPCNSRVGKGLFIYHVSDVTQRLPNYDVAVAEGKYDWTNPRWFSHPDFFDGDVPVFLRGTANRTGYDGRDGLPASNGTYWQDFLEDRGGTTVHVDRHWGDPKDAFTIGYNQVFSPWSNPNSNRGDGAATTIGAEITGKNSGPRGEDLYNVSFYVTSPSNAAPAKPQNLAASAYQSGGYTYPRLTWSAMLEPDVTSGGNILIERRVNPLRQGWTAWSTVATLAGTASEYIDYSIVHTCSDQNCPDQVQYRIRARDQSQKLSVYSETVTMTAYNVPHKELADGAPAEAPSKFALTGSYPNPFNPSTTIRYSLAKAGHVQLTVYNSVGQEVARLVDQSQETGYYGVVFHAEHLASGIYYARLHVTDQLNKELFQGTSRLVLTK